MTTGAYCSRTSASCMVNLGEIPRWGQTRSLTTGPTVIKLFESEIELKCKNRHHDFIDILCLF